MLCLSVQWAAALPSNHTFHPPASKSLKPIVATVWETGSPALPLE